MLYSLMQQYGDAEKSYRAALQRDPRLLNSYVGLAKVYQRTQNYQKALSAIDSAGKLDPNRTDIHYLRGQILLRLGRKEEGEKEVEASVRIDNERRAQRQKQVESGTVPSPDFWATINKDRSIKNHRSIKINVDQYRPVKTSNKNLI